MRLKTLVIIGVSILVFFVMPASFGHGVGYELLPPVKLGDWMVSLEVSTTLKDNPYNPERQISFALIDTSTSITVKEVTYHITAKKGSKFLFEDTFESKNGIFVMDFVPSNSNEVIVEKQNKASLFDTLLGFEKDVYVIKGDDFSYGGLYSFKVEILSVDKFSNKLSSPIRFDVGLSIPDLTTHIVDDPNFGSQKVEVITYYDQISNFMYFPASKSISFEMPFEWAESNINQTSIVHEELIISKTFGDLMSSSYITKINGIKVPDRVITIDEFSESQRTIHLVLNQKDLQGLLKENKQVKKMKFELTPEGGEVGTVTGNGQFRIHLSWEPKELRANSEAVFFIKVTDVFLKNKPVSVPFDLKIYSDEELLSISDVSNEEKDRPYVVKFFIPKDISGPITLQFENLSGNQLAQAALYVVVDRIIESEISIPGWVRNNAGWWADGKIGDKDFASGIEFLIRSKVVLVPFTESTSEKNVAVPDWVRNNAGWWADGKIGDKDFASGIQFLISKGIISV